MTYSIKGDPDVLYQKANQLADLAYQIERQLNMLNDNISPLRYTFIGQRAGSFFQQYDQFSSQMYSLRDIIMGFSGQLNEAANKLRSVDNLS